MRKQDAATNGTCQAERFPSPGLASTVRNMPEGRPSEKEHGITAVRAYDLRVRRGLTQQAAAERSGNLLQRTEIAKIEGGHNKATTERVQAGLARAYTVPQSMIGPYMRGEIDLDDLLSTSASDPGYARFGNLEAALAYHGDRWQGPTVAAARAYALTCPGDMLPAQWTDLLDKVESALASTGIVQRKQAERSK